MQERGLPIAAVLSVGNQAQVAIHDLLDVLAEDRRITAIGLYLETISDPVGFARAALKCAERSLPVVAIKAGRSETGARATLSHTSSLAGPDALVDAYLRRYGVIRVESLAELLETLKLVSVLGPLPGPRIGSLSCSGGDAAMVADQAPAHGLELAPLDEQSVAALRAALGERVAIANPLDYQTGIWANRARLRRCFEAMMAAGFDATLLVLDYPRPAENDVAAWDLAVDAFIAAAGATLARAIVVASLPETLPAAARERLMAAGIAPMQGLPECLGAIAAAVRLGEAWRRIAGSPPLPRLAGRAALDAPILLRERAAKELLAAQGVRVPDGEVAPIAQAVATAERLGFPVALKTAAGIAHKSEAGGVALRLGTAAAVASAATAMASVCDLVLVERMLPPPLLELIVGVAVDPQFGPHLVLGAGGTLVELWRDTALLVLPAARGDVEAALRTLRIWPLLAGHRGAPAADLEATLDAVGRIGALAVEHANRLLELEVNPLMVYRTGEGAIAADALIRLAAPIERQAPTMEQVA
jgi:acyl-CoA synthetase (NDP forming)